jgi:aminopeptidase N
MGVTKKSVNLCNFYPILCGMKKGGFYECTYCAEGDPFYADCADYKVKLTLPKDYLAAATGEIIDERMLESKKEYTMYATNVRDFAMVLSEKFHVLTAKEGNTELFYYYCKDEDAQKTMTAARESFRYFEKAFGKYPYDTYTVVETGFCYGGMEYPCLSLISDALKGGDRIRVTVHETAHQWWAMAVGSDQIENAWQDEGLAEYSTVLFFEEYEKYGFTREALVAQSLREYRSYYDVYGSVLGRTDTSMTRHLKDFSSGYEYRCLAYDKAVVMFDTLRKGVGDKKFLSALKRYYGANIFKIASAGALVGSFEKTGLDVASFFDSFLQGKAIL